MPSEMEKLFPQYWKNDTDDGGKNLHEEDFFANPIKTFGANPFNLRIP